MKHIRIHAIFYVLLCICSIKGAAGAGGNNMQPTGGVGTVYNIEGSRNDAAMGATSAAISKAVADGKAFLASSFGSNAAFTTTRKSADLKTYDSLGHRRLLYGGGAYGGSRGNNQVPTGGTGTVYNIEGDRNAAASRTTSDAITAAVLSGKAFLASSVGSGAALATTKKAADLKTYDTLGHRRLLYGGGAYGGSRGNNQVPTGGTGTVYNIEGDRNAAASRTTSDAITAAVLSGKAFLASSVGSGAALTTTKKAADLKTYDTLGHRRLLDESVITAMSDEIRDVVTADFKRAAFKSEGPNIVATEQPATTLYEENRDGETAGGHNLLMAAVNKL